MDECQCGEVAILEGQCGDCHSNTNALPSWLERHAGGKCGETCHDPYCRREWVRKVDALTAAESGLHNAALAVDREPQVPIVPWQGQDLQEDVVSEKKKRSNQLFIK